MRDRLSNMIQNAVNGCAKYWADVIADHLLAEGLIVPPCKCGDSIFVLIGDKVKEHILQKIEICGERMHFAFDWHGMGYEWVSYEDFGRKVFLTKEEAEKALAERIENGT